MTQASRGWHTLASPRIYIPMTVVLLGAAAFATLGGDDVGLSWDAVPLLALAAAVNLLAIPLWALRTRLVLRYLGYHAGLPSLMLLTAFANVGNQILPAAGGEVARGTYLSKLHDVPAASTAAALVFERLFGFLLMAATAFGALVALRLGVGAGVAAGVVAVLCAVGALTVVGRVRRRERGSLPAGAGMRRRFVASLASMSGEVRDLAAHPGLLGGFTAISLGVYAVLTAGFMLAAAAMGISLDPVQAWALHGAGMTIGTLSAIPFGLGASEATIASIGAWAGLAVVDVLAAAVGMRLALTLPMGLLGAASYLALSKRLGAKLTDPVAAAVGGGPE